MANKPCRTWPCWPLISLLKAVLLIDPRGPRFERKTMLMNLLFGIPMTLLCLLLQAVVVGLSLHHYMDYQQHQERHDRVNTILILSLVMLLMLLGNLMQMALWALLFVFLGEFENFTRALYFSGVTFATLGYGDVLLSPRWQLLSALEAANGILMFGVSTAVITAALGDAMKRYRQQLK